MDPPLQLCLGSYVLVRCLQAPVNIFEVRDSFSATQLFLLGFHFLSIQPLSAKTIFIYQII